MPKYVVYISPNSILNEEEYVIEACNTCKHYRRLGEYGEKLTCGKFGFRTKAFSVCDHFEMGA